MTALIVVLLGVAAFVVFGAMVVLTDEVDDT
jgi:hypothetical protein